VPDTKRRKIQAGSDPPRRGDRPPEEPVTACSAMQVAFRLPTLQVKHERIWGDLTAPIRWARGRQTPPMGLAGAGLAASSGIASHAQWGAQSRLGMRTRCPPARGGLGKQRPPPSPAAPMSLPGHTQTLHCHPEPGCWVPPARLRATPGLGCPLTGSDRSPSATPLRHADGRRRQRMKILQLWSIARIV